jgi:leader peptidase (prepilin peptidase)/N-methyltransferase
MHCGQTLSAIDLVPVFSYLFLRGRCRYCGSRISWQYPVVELIAALLGVVVYRAFPEPLVFFFFFCVWMTLLFIAVYDFRHGIIPLLPTLLVCALSILYAGMSGSFAALWAGPLLAAPLFFISLFSAGRLMGWADSLLELGLGTLLGLSLGLTGLVLSFWSGAAVGILLLLLSKRYTMRSEIPFAPFLIFGAGVAHLLHVDFFHSLPTFL